MQIKHLGQPYFLFSSVRNGAVRSPIGDPDLRSPSGFDSGLRPPLRMTRGAKVVRSTLGDPDLRSPSGFDSGLRPPLRMTQRGKFGKEN